MTPVDCTCDRGAEGRGICRTCLGNGWYLLLDADDERQLAAETN